MIKAGRVYLVGAGPGAPDLLTMRGAEIIRRADVIIYDYLASPEILRLSQPEAERIYAGKRPSSGHRFDQTEINQMMVEYARAGRCVVRLKGGDPFIFGRGGEEAEALAAAAIDFEVVPGVTSAIAVPAFAGIPLTHRDFGSFVMFVTGHQGNEKDSGETIPWEELARAAKAHGTIVILMATARMHQNLARLIAGGLDSETPAAAIQWGTTAAQRTVTASLARLAAEAERAGLGAPAVVVIGECVRFADGLNWTLSLPLFGRRIVITRSAANAVDFAATMRRLGAETIEFPTIETVAPDSYEELDGAIARLQSFHWIVFTSATGVDSFVARIRTLEADIRASAAARIAAIGPATAARLRHYGLKVAAVPAEFRAEAIIEALGTERVMGARFLIPRAQVAREVLPRLLSESGASEVVVAPAYKTTIPRDVDVERIRQLIDDHAIDLVTFTSSSTVNNFRTMVGTNACLKAAVIGPVTAETARARGFDVVVSSPTYTVDALVEAILHHFQSQDARHQNPIKNKSG